MHIAFRYRLLLPLITALLLIVGYPLGFSFWVSLQDYRLTAIEGATWIGIEHYIALLRNNSFWTALRNTLVFVATAVSLELLLGLSLAMLLHRRNTLGRNFFRSILLTPMFITPIAVGLMFRFLLNSQLGVITKLTEAIGLRIDWFSAQNALLTLALIDVWQWTPFMLLLLLAGLEALPEEPFEAARVDGASAWQSF